MLQTICGIIAGMFGALPLKSIDFELSSAQYVSISDANWGSYDRNKFAISFWIKRESIGITSFVCAKGTGNTSGTREFRIGFLNTNKLQITVDCSDGSSATLLTTATYASTSDWIHVLFWFDAANGTSGDRMRLWVDGTEVTAFDTDTAPNAGLATIGGDTRVGANISTNYFDGLVYQWAFFSGSLPAVTDLRDASTGKPKSVIGLPGLKSVLDVEGDVVTHDGKLASAWTNNNTAVASATIPT